MISLDLLNAKLDLLIAAADVTKILEVTMATIAEAKAAADALSANIGNLDAAVEKLIAAYNTAKNAGGISAADQASLDAAVSELQAASGAVSTESSNVAAALPPA